MIKLICNKKGDRMARINQNVLARNVTLQEAGIQQVSIAQVKEILRDTWEELIDKYGSHGIVRLEVTEHNNKIVIFAV